MISWASRRPSVVWAAGMALVLAGGIAFTRLPLATKTRVDLPRLTVSATWRGAAPEVVESYVTSPVEEVIQGVRGVKEISSESEEGSARITVELEPDADVTLARLEIHERLELLRKGFPLGVTAPTVDNYAPEDLAEQPLISYTFAGPYTPGALSRVARDDIRPRLSTVPGVSSVRTYGDAETRISVIYDPVRLRQLALSPELLATAVRNARVVRPLGLERRGAGVISVALRDQPDLISDLERLVVRAASGRVFRLGEVAAVRPEEDTGDQFYRVNGRTAVGFQVFREAGADAIHTAARVKEAVAELGPTLPPGIGFQLLADESKDLAAQLGDLTIRSGIAFLAVMLVLAIALRNVTSIWLVMGSAAVAIAGTALGLYLLEVPANLLTLAGLGMGIGVLVQNGLVVVERLRHAPDTPEGRAAAAKRILPAVLGSTLTTAVVLLPFLYLQGDARAAFVPFAAAFAMALGWSVFSSLVMIPAVGAGHGMERRKWSVFSRAYVRMLVPLLRWRWITLGLVVAGLSIAGWGFVTKVPRSSWGNWYGQRTTLNVYLNFPRGSDPASVDRGIREFEQIAVGRDGVERVEARSYGVGAGGLSVLFTREGGLTSIPLIMQEEMTQRAVLIGGASIHVAGQGPAFFSGGGTSNVTFRIKILGYSFSGVERLAIDLQQRLERIPRVRDVNINAGSFWGSQRAMSVTLEPDRDAIARAGITTQQFANAVAREVAGPVGGTRLELEGEEVTVTLKAKGSRERSLLDLRNAIVANPTGAPVRVSDLSELGEKEGLGRISREDQQYVRIVSYDFRGPSKLANRTHDAFMASIDVPSGYSVDDARFGWQPDESGKGLWLVFSAGVILVLLAVAFVFDSIWATAMVFLGLPVALAGVAGVFWATGTAFSREAAVGVILVVGLAVNQTILYIDGLLGRGTIGRYRRGTNGASVVAAARDRYSMIVLVTLTTLASLVPLAIGTEADSLFGSIALATAGGTIAGTIGALFVLPVMVAGRRTGPRRRRRKKPRPPAAPAPESA